jgi:1-deoxy-D-xylulose-5-phosphate reductoisomerase
MKKIVILGSTGSIGVNALEVIRSSENYFQVVALSGNNNYELLIEQIIEFNPKYISIGTKEGYEILEKKFPEKKKFLGEEGLKALAELEEYDILLTGISGAVGIEATIAGIKNSKRIALANKETMVVAGEYINGLLKEYPKAEIIPVDSEHSAIFQALQGGKRSELKKIIITASGGTFRGKKKQDLENVTVKEALKHPNWSMGKKITIDSSTLVNKGLEIIEAHYLFNVSYEDIEVIIHPESIIHSMVEFCDSSVIAQLGVPEMKLPIYYSFTYPERKFNSSLKFLDFKKLNKLTFEQPDNETFLGIELAYKAGKMGGSMPCVFNASNEIAVELFLEGKIKFLEIYEIIKEAMKEHKLVKFDCIEVIKKTDKEVREWVYNNYSKKKINN